MSDPKAESDATPRVTFCITELDVGGAEKAFVRVATGLLKKRWEVRVISLRDDGPLATPLRDAGIEVTSLRCGGFLDIRCYWRLRAELMRNPADVLMCFLHQANIYGRIAARFAKVPVVVSGIRVADRRLAVTLPEKLTRCCVNHYVAVSKSVGRTHAELCGISEDRMSAISNGVDVADDATVTRPSKKRREILFVGRLTEQKDPLLLLSAFQQLPESIRSSLRLTFVGEGPLRSQLEREISGEQLNDFVELAGQSEDVAEHMRRADLLVLPSRWEGMPNVVLEAMANGLPVIATAVDGTRDIIEDGVTGWLLLDRDAQALADLIRKVLDNASGTVEVAGRALAHVRQHFTWRNAVDQYDQLFRELS